MDQKALEEELRDFEEIESIQWLSENVIEITLRYPKLVKIYLSNPTKEKVRKRIQRLLQREIQVFLEPERHKATIESVGEIEVRKEEPDSG